VCCFLIATWLAVALVDYSPLQTTFKSTLPTQTNVAGAWGANVVLVCLFSVGAATWGIPILLYWTVYLSLRNARLLTPARYIANVVGIVAFSGLMAMLEGFKESDYFPKALGGMIGHLIYQSGLKGPLGGFGSAMLLGTVYAASLLFIFTKDIGAEIEKMLANFHAWRAERAKLKAELEEARRREKEDRAKQKAAAAALSASASASPFKSPSESGKPNTSPASPGPVGPNGRKTFVPKSSEDPLAKASTARTVTPAATAEASDRAAAADKLEKPETKPESALKISRSNGSSTATDTKSLEVATGKVELNIVKAEETKKAKITLPQSDDDDYQFPPLKLLHEQIKPDANNSEEEHRQNAENLLRILSEFGVEVSLGEIHVGPVITRYEVVPAPGVRVEKIAGLDKNIALGMRAQSVRILAPIPGKAAVGVEVPNQKPTPVGMREILESEDWGGAISKAELPIALGKDVSGKPLVSDLAKMPHLLIAGATGSGKSVCLNSIVASILYSKRPKDLRLIMVDPKVVELKVFNTLPHMLIPVVTEPKKVPAALKWLLGEMEHRYQIFAKTNVRNISGFNSRKRGAKPETPPLEAQAALEGVDPLAAADEIEIPDRLPYIVAIIDELADLMMVAPAEIETSIARLAQLARAAGIHLIIATQRPSVNVITGVIKANLPSRIAFQVASQVDSRTILDTKGADTLIGRGDMLFSPPGTSRLVRAQGAFVSDEEVQEMVEFLKKNGPPQYAQSVQQHIDRAAREDEEGEEGEDGDLGDDEDLYEQALEVLKSSRRASTSMLQRRLRIGYNRAARIMEIMEEKGIVGPENGSSPREILVDLDTL
jgi:S-DNA-T family DNA segregation ATPase FtsK/SpoIIIE